MLQQTLPTFFSTGLVGTGSHLLASALHLPSMNLHGLSGLLDVKGKGKEHAENTANVEDVRREGTASATETTQEGEQHEDKERCIYDRHIRLEHTPPFELPAPFPRTLSIEGKCSRSIFASCIFIVPVLIATQLITKKHLLTHLVFRPSYLRRLLCNNPSRYARSLHRPFSRLTESSGQRRSRSIFGYVFHSWQTFDGHK